MELELKYINSKGQTEVVSIRGVTLIDNNTKLMVVREYEGIFNIDVDQLIAVYK